MSTTIRSGNGRAFATADIADIIGEALLLPPAAISYHLGRRLCALHPSKALVETDGHLFSMEPYARAGHCNLAERVPPWSERSTYWRGPEKGVSTRPVQTWFEVEWRNQRLDVLVMNWQTGMGSESIS
jgi:hypothetical protein